MKPRIGLLLGDPTGIGPEVVAKLLSGYNVRDLADLLVIGDHRVFEMGQKVAGVSLTAQAFHRFEDVRFEAAALPLLNFPGVPPTEITVGPLSVGPARHGLVCHHLASTESPGTRSPQEAPP